MRTLLCIFLITLGSQAQAAFNVFACEPEWAALVQELAGDKADVYMATTAMQDPHRVQARPSLIARARRAQLLVCTGAELEIGWLPLVLQESANPAIAPGQPGNFEAARQVRLLDIPTRLDRAEGDVHAQGNPHIQLDARIYLPLALALANRLAELDPSNAAHYQARLQAFSSQWQAALVRWESQAAPLRGQPVVVQHRAYPYLENWLGLKQVAALEAKPGLEPGAAHLTQVLGELQKQPARMVLRATYQSDDPSEWIARRAHIPAVALPFSVGGTPGAKDLYGLFDDIIARLLKGLQP